MYKYIYVHVYVYIYTYMYVYKTNTNDRMRVLERSVTECTYKEPIVKGTQAPHLRTTSCVHSGLTIARVPHS